jgi:hypothetical protein
LRIRKYWNQMLAVSHFDTSEMVWRGDVSDITIFLQRVKFSSISDPYIWKTNSDTGWLASRVIRGRKKKCHPYGSCQRQASRWFEIDRISSLSRPHCGSLSS